ncbi:hypothetical protein ACHAXS_003681 [Conticribra weissflogii]
MSQQQSQSAFATTPMCNRLMPKCPPPPRPVRSALNGRYHLSKRHDDQFAASVPPIFPSFPLVIEDNVDFQGFFLSAPSEGCDMFSRDIASDVDFNCVAANSPETIVPVRIHLQPRVSLHPSRFAVQAPSLFPAPTNVALRPRPIRQWRNDGYESRFLSVEREMHFVEEEDGPCETEDVKTVNDVKNIYVTP